MPDHLTGQVTALFLYEAAEVIDLSKVATLIAPTVQARLSPKATTPPYVQYRQAPLTIDGEAIGLADDVWASASTSSSMTTASSPLP